MGHSTIALLCKDETTSNAEFSTRWKFGAALKSIRRTDVASKTVRASRVRGHETSSTADTLSNGGAFAPGEFSSSSFRKWIARTL